MAVEPFYSVGQKILAGKKITALDIGGATGLQPHWGKLLGNARCVMFEPHQQSYLELIKVYEGSPHFNDFIFLDKALSGGGGTRTFYKTNCPTGSSILEPNSDNPYVGNNNPYFYPYTTSSIETLTLKQALDQADIADVDMMKLDIQGAELEVIKGLDQQRLDSCLLIEAEVGLNDYHKNATSFPAINAFLLANDFELLDLRCNRGAKVLPGSPKLETYNEKYFGLKHNAPSIAARLCEFDALYVRSPIKLIQKRDERKLRNLIYSYCMYNFFGEALYVIELCLANNIMSQSVANEVGQQVANWHAGVKQTLSKFEALLEQNNYLLWGQYLWNPYPNF